MPTATPALIRDMLVAGARNAAEDMGEDPDRYAQAAETMFRDFLAENCTSKAYRLVTDFNDTPHHLLIGDYIVLTPGYRGNEAGGEVVQFDSVDADNDVWYFHRTEPDKVSTNWAKQGHWRFPETEEELEEVERLKRLER